MSTLAPIVAKLGKLIRVLSSDNQGEVVAAVQALRRTLKGAGADLHVLAAAIEKPNGALCQEDMQRIYDCGYQDGLKKAEDAQHGSATFRNIDGLSWHDMALFCQQRADRMKERHRKFVNDMASQTVWREPTEKQSKYLKSLFFKLGGKPP